MIFLKMTPLPLQNFSVVQRLTCFDLKNLQSISKPGMVWYIPIYAWQYIASSSRVLYELTALQYKLEYSVNRKAIRLQDASYPAISGISGYLTIRQRGRVVYELIVNKDAARADYLFRDDEAELCNCFSIHSYPKYNL